MTDGPTLVKLGGSLITDKSRSATARPEVLRALATDVARAREAGVGPLLLGHGSGSFGHVEAHRHGLQRPAAGAEWWMGVARTQDRAAVLHRLVIRALLEAGVATFSWAPASALVASGGRPARGHVEPVVRALEAGLLPVVFGDVVLDESLGAAICSTERAFVFLTAALGAVGRPVRRALWMGETDGIRDAAGDRIETIDEAGASAARGAVGGARGMDVTGGMAHRLEAAVELAGLDVESWILDGRRPGALLEALAGRPSGGTRVLRHQRAAGPGP